MPMGAPGWPELAFCTASIARARRELAISVARDKGAFIEVILVGAIVRR
jgi:hypothetical protein